MKYAIETFDLTKFDIVTGVRRNIITDTEIY